MMSSGLELTESFFADAADAAHQGTSPESQVITYYTNVCDLKRKQFVLYYLFDFSRPRVFDLAEELELSGGAIPMADLFGEPFSGQRPEIEFHLEQYLPGHRLSVLVRDRFANLDPELRDRLLVTVSGDRETAGELLQLTEIGPNLGVFVGAMSMGLGSPVPGDGVLQVDPGDLITATYNHHLKGGEITEKGERAYTSVYCDLDGDGVDADECGGTDCDDERPDMYPDAQEFCDGDDDDCDTVIDEGCVDCMAPQEPDATADGLAPNPLGCGQCVSGDFDETFYGDQGHYRIWVDAYAIDAEAGQKLISTVHRAVPNGVLQQQLFDPSFAEVLADDELFGVLEHTVEESGTYYLVLLMSRVDHTIEPNAYQLELHCRSVANRVDDNRHSRTSAGPTDIR